jgi:hypothetical protein
VERRSFLALPFALLACGPKAPAATIHEPQGPPPHLEPATDLCVSTAALEWLIALRPRELTASEELIVPISKIIPEERFVAFAEGHGGVDLRQLKELVVARYAGTRTGDDSGPKASSNDDVTLWVARGVFDPARVEHAFDEIVDTVDARVVDRAPAQVAGGIKRLEGRRRGAPIELALFGREAISLQTGARPAPARSPLRIAELLAENKLKKVAPALQADPLNRTAQLLGDAPARGFAPGPFAGDWRKGFGGLLGACTSAGIALRSEPRAGGKAALALTLALIGEWRERAEAQTRLLAWLDTFQQEALGRLLGVDRPLEPPRVRFPAPDAMLLDFVADADRVARGIHDAVDANIREIMSL